MRNKIVLSDGTTELTKIKGFRYTSQVGVDNAQFRFGSVCSGMIEFDYYISGNSIINAGDSLYYYQVVNIDKYLDPIVNDGTRDVLIGRFYVKSAETGKATCHVIAYDPAIKLDVDYSERLKALENNFPATLEDLLVDAANYCGMSYTPPEPDPNAPTTITFLPIKKFYMENVTCRDIFSWVSELVGENVFTGSDENGDYVYYYYSHGTDWLNPPAYIICPTDQNTYIVSGSTKLNVYYKENGFQESTNTQCEYDGVKFVDGNGNIIAQYSRYVSPTVFYYINGNPLLNVIRGTSTDFDNAARTVEASLYSNRGYKPTTVKLFPFRNPYSVGGNTFVVDGRLPYAQQVPRRIPINRITVTESEVILEAFGAGETENSYSPVSMQNKSYALSTQQEINAIKSTISESHVQFNTTTDWAIFKTVNSNFSGWYSIRGNIMTLYMYLYSNSPPLTGATWAVLKSKYRPPYNYMVYPVFNSTAPYTPNGSVWVYANGNVVVYYGSGSPSYACMTFVLKD